MKRLLFFFLCTSVVGLGCHNLPQQTAATRPVVKAPKFNFFRRINEKRQVLSNAWFQLRDPNSKKVIFTARCDVDGRQTAEGLIHLMGREVILEAFDPIGKAVPLRERRIVEEEMEVELTDDVDAVRFVPAPQGVLAASVPLPASVDVSNKLCLSSHSEQDVIVRETGSASEVGGQVPWTPDLSLKRDVHAGDSVR